MIDSVPPADLIRAIKQAPSLRGMILGYVAELMFHGHVTSEFPEITDEHIAHHDDHDRLANKSDRTIIYRGRSYGIQLKSMQTNSITLNKSTGVLEADVQNDGSDRRSVILSNGSIVQTTCYRRGDYDILAVPLFPFSGEWTFAYKRNLDCRSTTSSKYTPAQAREILSSTERITWPLTEHWTTDLLILLTGNIGRPLKARRPFS